MTACQSPSLTIFSSSNTWSSSTVDTDRSEMSESSSLNADSTAVVPDLESDMARFQAMFTYMCKSVYGLAMNPDNNVSSNIGYEKVAGTINNQHN